MQKTEINTRILILLLSSIFLIVLPHAWHIPLPIFLFFNLLLSWRLISLWKTKWLPNKTIIFLITLLGIFLLMVQHQGIMGRDAGTALFVTALGLKLLEIKDKSDLYLICYLAFFVAATQFLYLQNIFMAAYILIISCLLITTLIVLNSKEPDTFSSAKLASTIIIQAIPITIVVFVFFPRLEAPRWKFFSENSSARTGLSDTLKPGSISQLGLSGELAFRVKFDGKIPPPSERYWRGPVFTRTDGKSWTSIKSHESSKLQSKPEFSGYSYDYIITIEPHSHSWVFALDMPAKYPSNLMQNADYQLINPKKPVERSEYQLSSFTSYKTLTLSKREQYLNLQLPEKPSTRLADLVKKLGGHAGSPQLFIHQTLNFFKNNDFYYTLNPPLYPDNPIETFLFDSHYGYCSHYATAFVYLMRAGGLPARVVTGYQGGELNSVGNFLEIRQANAHAWAEVWLKGKGWRRVDPTAVIVPERIEQNINIEAQMASGEISFIPVTLIGDANWLNNVRFIWNDLDYRWQRWVINYNSKNRSQFLSSLGINGLRNIAIWLIVSISSIIALLSLILLRNQKKKEDKASVIYKKFCAKLAKKQLLNRKGEGANNFAKRAVERFPEQAYPITDITDLYLKIRYGRFYNDKDIQLLEKKVSLFQI